MKMLIKLRQVAYLLLGLTVIIGNTSAVYAHGSAALSETAGSMFQAGYIMYFALLVGGYFLMHWEIPQLLTKSLFGAK